MGRFNKPFKAAASVSQTVIGDQSLQQINLDVSEDTRQFKLVNNTIVVRKDVVANVLAQGSLAFPGSAPFTVSGAILLNGVPLLASIVNQTVSIAAVASGINSPINVGVVAVKFCKGDVITFAASSTEDVQTVIPALMGTSYTGYAVTVLITVVDDCKDDKC
jgi:hypothetical protein